METLSSALSTHNLYRLPWNLTDNGISWLEVTANCNLDCKGCYRDRKSTGHKPLSEIEEDLAVFARERVSDCMSIAGGDPLVHPEIVEIVRRVRARGWKPILNTNGLALTPELLRELKRAGVYGFTFHIDTSQNRPDLENPPHGRPLTEADLNPVRERYAKMLAHVGGIACSFNQTVTCDTLGQVPAVVDWAQRNDKLVHTMVFILYRDPIRTTEYDFYAGGKKVMLEHTYDVTDWGDREPLKAQDLVRELKKAMPQYEPCAYLNGTVAPKSLKWLLGMRFGLGVFKSETLGFMRPWMMKLIQTVSHLVRNKYLSYVSPQWLNILGLVRLQAFMIIQPIDFLPDGRQNMCDGCPDMTVHKGKLYWSCRLEEIKKYGAFLSSVPRG